MIWDHTIAALENQETFLLVGCLRCTHELSNDDVIAADKAYALMKEWNIATTWGTETRPIKEMAWYQQARAAILLVFEDTLLDRRGEGFEYFDV
jgi:hypothetical protein